MLFFAGRVAMGWQLQRIDSLPKDAVLSDRLAFLIGSFRSVGSERFGVARHVSRRLQGQLHACGVPIAGLALPVVNTLVTLIWLQFSVLSAKPIDVLWAIAIFAGFSMVTIAASTFSRTRGLAAVAGTLAVMFGGFAAASFPSALGAAQGGPLWDGSFLWFDELLGIHHPTLFTWFVQSPYVMQVIAGCYGLTILVLPMACISLVILKRYDRVRELNFLFGSSITVVVAVAALMPAAGLMTAVRLPADVLMALPEEAGVYHLELFYALRAGMPMAYGPFDNPGLIVFPSFHTCMALLIAYAFRDDPVMRWPALLYGGCTIAATVPMGSHYVADVIGGAAIFATCAWFQQRYLDRGPEIEGRGPIVR